MLNRFKKISWIILKTILISFLWCFIIPFFIHLGYFLKGVYEKPDNRFRLYFEKYKLHRGFRYTLYFFSLFTIILPFILLGFKIRGKLIERGITTYYTRKIIIKGARF